MSKADKKILKQLTDTLNRMEEKEELASAFGQRIGRILNARWPDDTSCWALVLANAIVSAEDDCGNRRGCRGLLVQWMMEHYAGCVVSENWQNITNIHQKLVSLKYTSKDPYVFNDLDDRAWHEKADSKKVFVFEGQSRRTLVIIDGDSQIHARRVWYRCDEGRNATLAELKPIRWYKKNGWAPEYGDCRDSGYILSRDWCSRLSNIDRADHSWTRIDSFIRDMKYLYGMILEIQTERMGELYRSGKLKQK